jgi:hypothetical protein
MAKLRKFEPRPLPMITLRAGFACGQGGCATSIPGKFTDLQNAAVQTADPEADRILREPGSGLLLGLHSGKSRICEFDHISCVPADTGRGFDLNTREIRLNPAGDLLTLCHRNRNVCRYRHELSFPAAYASDPPMRDPGWNFDHRSYGKLDDRTGFIHERC